MSNIDLHIIEQSVSLMQTLPLDKQKSVMDYIQFLVSQSDSHADLQAKTKPTTHHITSSDLSTLKHEGELSDLFGMVKTDRSVSLEEMDEVIRKRGAGL